MNATMCLPFVPKSKRPNADGSTDDLLKVFDVDLSEWRSFYFSKLMEVKIKNYPNSYSVNYVKPPTVDPAGIVDLKIE